MARILDLFMDWRSSRGCERYADAKLLYEGLLREERAAIQCLYAKVSGSIFKIGAAHGLTPDDIEELICDCITLCLQKIKTGQFVFQGYHPATYTLEIAKNRAKNIRRSIYRHISVDLEAAENQVEETSFSSFADTEILTKMMDQLDESCRKLVQLKYLEGMRDKEIIDQKLTQYSTVDALKNNRARCMKKLVEIGSSFVK